MNDWINTILEDCVTALVCPRTEFYPDKNFGSHIKRAKKLLDCEKLLAFARQALSEFDGVYVKSAIMKSDSADFLLLINDYEREVSISL
ncbi:MAG: hypothetical protein K2H13_03325 [Eubacterium sp.]|nr:hypothetical protein [Eubacterium sp.]MDE6154858.1 hypothetical protein [Eubacterium sp.]MDE6767876.1 hypothetical protein [Eubacterium sp.]